MINYTDSFYEAPYPSPLTCFARGAERGHISRFEKSYFLCNEITDSSKDQSYFLWTLTEDDLSHTLFPIGHLKKSEVSKLAKKYKIPVAEKKDSQGVCFLGPLDMKDFLKHYIETKKGDVLNTQREIIGDHDGAVFYTLGERHGFSIIKNGENNKPLYVVGKDIDKNTITVSDKRALPTDPTGGNLIEIENVNWVIKPEKEKVYQAQIRYHGELLDCRISDIGLSYSKVVFKKEVLVDSGQSVVVYDENICLGGGIVK